MVGDNKDRLGDKLDDIGAAREDQWARKRDAELVDKLKKRLGQVACPNCKQFLVPKTDAGVPMLSCPAGHGAWLDSDALKAALAPRK
jgi:hypothetical protein